jgi:biotin-(acetyl-CoA carboxylase) ligase
MNTSIQLKDNTMSKLKENMKRLRKEGILDKVLMSITKQLKKMNDKQFQQAKSKYNRETAHLFQKLRDLEKNNPDILKK